METTRIEKFLKSVAKRKFAVTESLVVAFIISGFLGMNSYVYAGEKTLEKSGFEEEQIVEQRKENSEEDILELLKKKIFERNVARNVVKNSRSDSNDNDVNILEKQKIAKSEPKSIAKKKISGNYIKGLSNTIWDENSITPGMVATEDQLYKINENLSDTIIANKNKQDEWNNLQLKKNKELGDMIVSNTNKIKGAIGLSVEDVKNIKNTMISNKKEQDIWNNGQQKTNIEITDNINKNISAINENKVAISKNISAVDDVKDSIANIEITGNNIKAKSIKVDNLSKDVIKKIENSGKIKTYFHANTGERQSWGDSETNFGVFNAKCGATGKHSVAAGANAKASGIESTAIGYENKSLGNWSTTIGYNNKALKDSSVAIGNINEASGETSVTVGYENKTSGWTSIAIGHINNSLGTKNISIGFRNYTGYRKQLNLFSTGYKYIDELKPYLYIYLDRGEKKLSDLSPREYENLIEEKKKKVYFKPKEYKDNTEQMALGYLNEVTGNKSIAVGDRNFALEEEILAFGSKNIILGENNAVFGSENLVHKKANNNFILGNNIIVDGGIENSVVLGNNSELKESNIISIGSKNNERRIVNVAKGKYDTDAVNLGQLTDGYYNKVEIDDYVQKFEEALDKKKDKIVDNDRDKSRSESRKTLSLKMRKEPLEFSATPLSATPAATDLEFGSEKEVMFFSGGGAKLSLSAEDTSVNVNGGKIVNVGDGEVSATSTDAVNGSQLYAVDQKVESYGNQIQSNANEIYKLDGRIKKVGALSSALAGLHPMQYDPMHPNQVMASLGSYRGEQAVAVGMTHYFNENLMASGGISVETSERDPELMGNIGFTWKLGKDDREEFTTPVRYNGKQMASVYMMQSEIDGLIFEKEQDKKIIKEQIAKNKKLENKIELQNKEIKYQKKEMNEMRARLDKLEKIFLQCNK